MATPDLVYLGAVLSAAVVVAILVLMLLSRRRKRRRAARAQPAAAGGLSAGLANTRASLWDRLQAAWSGGGDLDARLANLEEALVVADVGMKSAHALLERVRARGTDLNDLEAVRQALREEMVALLAAPPAPEPTNRPHVVVMVGVNGVGKTTTIAKLTRYHREAGRSVLLVAGDTFRAGAVDQLVHWADKLGVECVRQEGGANPSAVAYDGIRAAIARNCDVVIIDTAGRLHVKANLVNELQKVMRIIGRELPGAPHETLLVIDATTGLNAVAQAKIFAEAAAVTGLVLTKIDGTAKGGAMLAIRNEIDVPVRYVGFGERPEDFAPFDPVAFVDAILPPA